MKKAIVVGASSGIGRALAELLAADGYEVGLASRRLELLAELAARLPTRSYVRELDVESPEAARQLLAELIAEMGGVDVIVLSSGVTTRGGTWEDELRVVRVNVAGFVALASLAMSHFLQRGSGHLVGLSSVSALRAAGVSSAYSASKAFVSRYLEGQSVRADSSGADVRVTDVKPGFVETAMTEGQEGLFWVAPVEVAARQIYAAMRRRRRHVYITRRWRLVAWLMRILPYPLLVRLTAGKRG